MTAVYSGALTREQFLFRETRIVARLVLEGMEENDIVSEVYTRNLFQYPTERLLKNIAGVCLKRLAAIKDAPDIFSGLVDSYEPLASRKTIPARATQISCSPMSDRGQAFEVVTGSHPAVD